MGSVDFIEVYRGEASAGDAWRGLYEQARREYGSNPYSGTIATTAGVAAVHTDPMYEAEAMALVDERIERLSRGEYCEAIPLRSNEGLTTKTVTLSIPGSPTYDETAEAIRRKVGKRYVKHSILDTGVTVRQPKATVPKEKARTIYYLRRGEGSSGQELQGEYATQAEARAAAVEILSQEPTYGYRSHSDTLSVHARIVRESGAPLVTIERVFASTTITAEVTLRPANDTPGERAGWLIYGIAGY